MGTSRIDDVSGIHPGGSVMRKEFFTDRDDLFVVHDFLSPAECEHFIARSEAAGFGDAPINQLGGPAVRKDVRNNDRVMIDDPALAAEWWERARPFVPEARGQWRASGLNERFRFYRYQPGQRFHWHFDGRYERSPLEESALTFMVYLNEGFGGGATEFDLDPRGGTVEPASLTRVIPRAGMLLVFTHGVLHQGAMVTAGTKYVARSDVMYRWAGGK
jgi:hypothetical protein